MKFSTLCFFCLLTVVGTLAIGCTGKGNRVAEVSDSLAVEREDYTAEAIAWADSLIETMTQEQRIGQLFMPAMYAEASLYNLKRLTEISHKWGIGGIILLQGTSDGACRLGDSLRNLLGEVRPWVAIDAETGLGMRLTDAPLMPSASELGQTSTEQEVYDLGRCLASECRKIGVNMVLGPVLDVIGDSHDFMARRSFGISPGRVAELGVGLARGLEDGGVVSVAKHFPGHGSAVGDSHSSLPIISISLDSLVRRAIPPFREYVDEGLSAVMIGHLAVPAIDPDLRSAAFSSAVVTDLLRGDLGFRGLVVTDALNMQGATGIGKESTSLQAIKAGADMVLAPNNLEGEMTEILTALADGRLSESRLRESLRRILLLKYRFLKL